MDEGSEMTPSVTFGDSSLCGRSLCKIILHLTNTVKKYIIPGYTTKNNIEKKVFHKDDLPEFATDLFCGVDNWGDLCRLSESEKEEIVVLWDEMLI